MPRLSNAALLALAVAGFVIPNALFIPWVLDAWPDLGSMFRDRLAMAFALDATLAMIWITVHLARDRSASVRWPWFIVLSLAGGMGFAIPFYFWLNRGVGDGDRSSAGVRS